MATEETRAVKGKAEADTTCCGSGQMSQGSKGLNSFETLTAKPLVLLVC